MDTKTRLKKNYKRRKLQTDIPYEYCHKNLQQILKGDEKFHLFFKNTVVPVRLPWSPFLTGGFSWVTLSRALAPSSQCSSPCVHIPVYLAFP